MARSALERLLTRAITPALGNLKKPGQARGSNTKVPLAGTQPVTFVSPNIPMQLDQASIAYSTQAFRTNVFVMRCVETIATTISGLPFHAGMDPEQPEDFDPTAPLAQLLGPATPQAPGGPNPMTSARMLWDWTIKQYVVYGRWGWECQTDNVVGPRRQKMSTILALWPLVAEFLYPYPTDGGTQFFNGFRYQTPTRDIELNNEQVFYAWKPSLQDWRQAESVLDAARDAIHISSGLDRYMSRLLDNNMVATTMVVSPPFDEPAGRRAFRDQFRSRYQGVEHAGSTVFAEAERDEEDTTGQPILQIERIAQTAVEASSIQISNQAKIDITIALGVPMSLIGNASQRTYANASEEYKNFWTLRVLPMIADLQEYINVGLSPRVGQEVGWFDLSHVEVLKPPALFAPPMIGDVINFGVADAEQVANVLGIPAANATNAADIDTVDIDVESSQIGAGATSGGAGGGRGDMRKLERVTKAQMMSAYTRYRTRPLNTHNLEDPFTLQRWIRREHIDVRRPALKPTEVIDRTDRILAQRKSKALIERTEAITGLIRQLAAQARDVGQDNDAYREGVADRVDGNPMHSAVSFAQGHPNADADDYPLYVAGYNADRDDLVFAPSLRPQRDSIGPGTKVLWAGPGGSLSENISPIVSDEGDQLTTWDGDLESWIEANEPLLEKFALAAPE